MPSEVLQRCPKCKRDRPEADWCPSQWGDFGKWCRDCLAASVYVRKYLRGEIRYPFRVYYRRRCDQCAVCFTSQKAYGRFCGFGCKDRHRKDALIAERVAARPDRDCLHCGGPIAKTLRNDAKFCSERCNTAAHQLKRGNGRVGPGRRRDIERAAIIARDNGVCHICGGTPAPEDIHLDHIVPLARGGTHDPENLAVACARCNLSKGAR